MPKTWSIAEIRELYEMPVLDLAYQAATVHRQHHSPREIQVCQLFSIKTGGCPEDCKYCAFSSSYPTGVKPQPLMKLDVLIEQAKLAVQKGCTRICLGAALREVRHNHQFEQILEMIKAITKMGVEVCCTLGMLDDAAAKRLVEAGLYSYNHNLDTSEKYYPEIITTRTYQDRLDTLKTVKKNHLGACCGGIIGMGETQEDRIELLHTLANLDPYPDSVPINRLVPIPGTPLGNRVEISVWEVVRMVAVARIIMPKAMVRLSAGRLKMTAFEQAFCFLAGANSIHTGKLLTVLNPGTDEDDQLLHFLGLYKREPFKKAKA